MRKLICILLSILMVISLFVVSFTAFASESQESNNIDDFIDGITELVREYDSDKEFTVPENDVSKQIQSFSAENTVDETDNNAEQEYPLQDFQTARLIVRADGKFDDFDALEHVSGFEDFHILQYEGPEAAMEAYGNLQTQKTVYSAAPDEVVAPLQGEKVKTLSKSEVETKDYLCDWSVNRTQSKRLQEYLLAENIPMQEVVIGVIDNGVYYDHEFLEGRILRTYYNNTESGMPNDEYGAPEDHGTAVCSVIVDNTPQNVKITMFKVLNDNGLAPTSMIAIGILEAVERNVDVISISLGYFDNSGLTAAAVRMAYACNIPMFACVSNDSAVDDTVVPANVPECIAVTSSNINGLISEWTTWTHKVDIAAPGEDIVVATMQDEYDIWSGTSFATPCAAALGAILKSVYPNITVDEIDERIKETAFAIKETCGNPSAQGQYLDDYYTIYQGAGIVQFCNALGVEKLAAGQTNLEDKTYIGAQLCSLQCADENAVLLYTVDGTYPTLENALVYTAPFEITKRTRIRVVAYYPDCDYYSDEVEVTPRIHYLDDEACFEINDAGVITKYTGTERCLYVPETIKGISVTGFESGVFNNNQIIELTLPETIKEIPEKAFYQNTVLEYISAEGVTAVCDSAFFDSNLRYAELPSAKELGTLSFARTYNFLQGDFSSVEKINTRAFQYSTILYFDGPNVTEICSEAFRMCSRLLWAKFPVCKTLTNSGIAPNGIFYNCYMLLHLEMPLIEYIPKQTFYKCRLKEADFPLVTEMDTRALCCTNLEYINMPSLLSVPDEAFGGTQSDDSSTPRVCILENVVDIGENAFGEFTTCRAEFSHLSTAKSLPYTDAKTPCIITMPSTFRECTEDTVGRNYKVYGTKGTYAETWTNENGHEFIELSQETAVLQDVPMAYTGEEILKPDVLGFNKTYQWYGNTTADNMTGTPIESATDKEFNPADYEAYPYYYCVVTSTDVGYDPIEIRTGVTQNKTLKSADYSAYDAAVLKANALKREYYKDLTALDAALAVNVQGLTELDQSIVDAQTKAIEDALTALEFKDADYSAYNAAVEKANVLDKSLYADTTELDSLLAEDISGLTILNQDIVDEQMRAIEDALKNLVFKPADYTEVEKANALNRDLYEDLTALDEALAVDVSGKNITEQAEVDEQTQVILNAIFALTYKPADYTEYNNAVEQANALNRDLYEDLTALDEALSVDVSGKNITEQADVDSQTQAILAAIENLVKKPVTEPEMPGKPSQPVIEAPSETEIITQSDSKLSTDIKSPQTGANASPIFSLSFICIFSAAVLVFTNRKRKH